jgi:hypothetical protein
LSHILEQSEHVQREEAEVVGLREGHGRDRPALAGETTVGGLKPIKIIQKTKFNKKKN